MSPSRQKQFLQLLKPHEGGIQAYTRYLAWNPNDAEDIFQTALMNAFQKFHTFEMGTNFRAWFLKFITFAAFNMNRKHARISSREVVFEAESLLQDPSPEEPLTESGDVHYDQLLKDPDLVLDYVPDTLREAVRMLPEKRRSIFLLRSVNSLSYQEIASILDIPIGTVMGELHRARKFLRGQLKTYIREHQAYLKRGDDDVD